METQRKIGNVSHLLQYERDQAMSARVKNKASGNQIMALLFPGGNEASGINSNKQGAS
jgi:hypothetical protein